MSYISDLISRYPALQCCENDVKKSCDMLQQCFCNGGKLLLAGNGGSAADCDHITGELLKSFVLPRKIDEQFLESLRNVHKESADAIGQKLQGSFAAIALSNNSALMTASANDTDANVIFAQQVMGLGNNGDVFFAISTSGNSKNVVYATAVAKAKGLSTIALTGRDGGELKKMCEVSIVVPEKETYKIQEFHLPIYHTICLELEERFFGKK